MHRPMRPAAEVLLLTCSVFMSKHAPWAMHHRARGTQHTITRVDVALWRTCRAAAK